MPAKPRVITIEEHYQDPDVLRAYAPEDQRQLPAIAERLNDLTNLRIKEMDEAGIDMQVLSHANPGLQKMDAATAVRLARNANDRLAETVRAHPDRFAAFAAIPTPDPKAAADELERAVTQLGFKGALINGTTNGVFFDDKRFWPICERAAALDVPLYLHPTMPHQAVIDTYYKDYAQDWPMLLRAAWGFTVETATQGVRMVLSGVFDAYPESQNHPGPSGRGPAVPAVAHRHGFFPRRRGKIVPRRVQRTFLHHHQRLLLQPGVAVLRAGAWRGPHHVLGRLPVRRQQARNRLAADHPAMRRGQGEDRQRQCGAAAEAVTNPFVVPEEPTAADAIAAIGDELAVFDDWMERYQFIIELGRKLPPFPDAWADDAHRVPGCQSKVWMEGALTDGRLFLAGVSDAAIVSGLIALLLRVYSGRTPEEIVATDPVFLKDLGLLEALSTNRGNGIAAMARKIRQLAALQRAA